MVGGFGNEYIFSFLPYFTVRLSAFFLFNQNKKAMTELTANSDNLSDTKLLNLPSTIKINSLSDRINDPVAARELGPYLAGLIEGDGTFAVHNTSSTAKRYSPIIIIVFKKSDYPFAKFLRDLTNCGTVYSKPNRGYVLWQIQDRVSVFTIVSLINGYMRTPKIEALHRTIAWFNNYILKSEKSKLPSTIAILSKINPIELKPLDVSEIDSNSWLAGFTDADGNFSINIHQRSNKNSTRVQLYYRLEINQNYHRADAEGKKSSFFTIMSKIAMYLDVNVYSRSRTVGDKEFFSFTVVSHNKKSQLNLINYFNKFPLLSSKFLDYKDWICVLELQKANPLTTTYLDKAINIRTDFNSTRTTYNWNHLNDCYLISKG